MFKQIIKDSIETIKDKIMLCNLDWFKESKESNDLEFSFEFSYENREFSWFILLFEDSQGRFIKLDVEIINSKEIYKVSFSSEYISENENGVTEVSFSETTPGVQVNLKGFPDYFTCEDKSLRDFCYEQIIN